MNKIKAARIAAGLTQAQVYELLRIPLRTLQDWENDRRKPPEWAERLIIKELKKAAKFDENYNYIDLGDEVDIKE